MNTKQPKDDVLRAVYEGVKRARPACPSADVIRQYLADDLPADQRPPLDLHLNNCAQCIEVMERFEATEAPSLERGPEEKLEREIAVKLDFEGKEGGGSFLHSVDWLWRRNVPLFVPAALAALLLCLVWMLPGTGHHPVAPESVVLPVRTLTIDQTVTRTGPGTDSIPSVAAGQVLLVEVFLARLDLVPGDRIQYVVNGVAGERLSSGETALLEDSNIRLALTFARAGECAILFFEAGAEIPLEEVRILVTGSHSGT